MGRKESDMTKRPSTHTETHTYELFFHILFRYRLLQVTEYHSLCFTVGPCLFLLHFPLDDHVCFLICKSVSVL